jgi:lysozyme
MMIMDLVALKNEIQRYEGYRNVVYLDTLGNPTVGIGHLDRNLVVGSSVTDDQIANFFNQDSANAISICTRIFNTWDSIDEFRQRVLVQLAFNLASKLAEFHNMLACIQTQDWQGAANELQNSLWFTQVGSRGPETCSALINGVYPWENGDDNS